MMRFPKKKQLVELFAAPKGIPYDVRTSMGRAHAMQYRG
jgi:hypothetical protein